MIEFNCKFSKRISLKMIKTLIHSSVPNNIKLEIITKASILLKTCFQSNQTFFDYRYNLLLNGILIVPQYDSLQNRYVQYLALEGVATKYINGNSYIELIHNQDTSLSVFKYIPQDKNLIKDLNYTNERTLGYAALCQIFDLNKDSRHAVNLWFKNVNILTQHNINYQELILNYPLELIPKMPIIDSAPIGTINPSQDFNRTYRIYKHRKKIIDSFINSLRFRL